MLYAWTYVSVGQFLSEDQNIILCSDCSNMHEIMGGTNNNKNSPNFKAYFHFLFILLLPLTPILLCYVHSEVCRLKCNINNVNSSPYCYTSNRTSTKPVSLKKLLPIINSPPLLNKTKKCQILSCLCCCKSCSKETPPAKLTQLALYKPQIYFLLFQRGMLDSRNFRIETGSR